MFAGLIFALTLPSYQNHISDIGQIRAPAGRAHAQVVPGGTTILPNGRFLTPAGHCDFTNYDLWNVLVSPDGNTAVGLSDNQANVVTSGGNRIVKLKGVAPCGAFTPDSKAVWLSMGEAGTLAAYDIADWKKLATISFNDSGHKDAYLTDVAIPKSGSIGYALDIANQEVDVFDLTTLTVIDRIKAGREPYALALDEGGQRLFVANIGVFDYSLIPPSAGMEPKKGISRPAFAFPSREAENGVNFEGRFVPGLGKIGTADGQSIWVYSLAHPRAPVATKKVVSGLLIHAPADAGKSFGASAPNALAINGSNLWVSNANNDTVQAFTLDGLHLLKTIKLTPTPLVAHLRGVIPTGLCFSQDGSRLFVCESGLNAVAVIDPVAGTVLGQIPTGWFPLQVRLAADGKSLIVATQKGLGTGPKGGFNPRSKTDPRFGLADMPGMVETIAPAEWADLEKTTDVVLRNNGLVGPAQQSLHFPKEVKYVVFITKENHTFDGIFGGLKGADGEPRYAQFGQNGWIAEKGQAIRLPVMPNHIRLAEQFSISDNFYMEPHYSGDGHRWLVGVYPSLWTTRVYYSGWGWRPSNTAKGRLVSFGSNGSQIPEDYLENGSLWEHLAGGRVPFRNYGEGFEFPGVDEGDRKSRSGAIEPVNFPMPKALFNNTCFEFPIFNTTIPDIARVDWFKDDVKSIFRDKGKPLPKFINIALCNDHGDSPRPKYGYPYTCSYMADNDLALGRVVEFLSHTPEWKHMAIFVTQDDPGGDNDHVDRHRSFVMAIGPYCKHGYVSHDHTSIMSIIRSIYTIFGLGPSNMFDALATPLDDMFTDVPDFSPYEHVESDPRIFQPGATFDPNDPKFERRRQQSGVRMDDPDFIKRMERGASTAGSG